MPDTWRRRNDTTPEYQEGSFNFQSEFHLNTSESHQLCLEHHRLFICVHLTNTMNIIKDQTDILIPFFILSSLSKNLTSTSLNTSFPHLTLILKAGMLTIVWNTYVQFERSYMPETHVMGEQNVQGQFR